MGRFPRGLSGRGREVDPEVKWTHTSTPPLFLRVVHGDNFNVFRKFKIMKLQCVRSSDMSREIPGTNDVEGISLCSPCVFTV